MGAVTPGETLGTLYNIHVGSNKTNLHHLRAFSLLVPIREPLHHLTIMIVLVSACTY